MTRTALVFVIRNVHHLILLFVMLGWAIPDQTARLFHLIFLPVMVLQWWLNQGTCILTNLEAKIKGESDKPKEEQDSQFVRSVLAKFSQRDWTKKEMAMIIYGAVLVSWMISASLYFMPQARAEEKSLQERFEEEVKKRLEVHSIDYLIRNKRVAISLIDLNAEDQTPVSIGGERMMCSASMGKWACAVGAAELIHQGKLKLSNDEKAISQPEKGIVTIGDLHAMMQASDNASAARVCRTVNAIGSPGYHKSAKTSCYTHKILKKLGINPKNNRGIINGNLFDGGKKPRCEEGYDLKTEFERKRNLWSNVGTTNAYAKLLKEVYSNKNWKNFSWLRFNRNHKRRSFDYKPTLGLSTTGRFVEAFGCKQKDAECPIVSRKTGTLDPEDITVWRCHADSVVVETETQKFALVMSCNEPKRSLCWRQERYNILADIALDLAEEKRLSKPTYGNQKTKYDIK